MATITILEGPEPVKGRKYNVSEPNVAVTVRELIRGAEAYNNGRIVLSVDAYPSAAEQRRQALARQEAAAPR